MFNPNPMHPIISMSFGFSTPKAHEQGHLRRKGRPTTECDKALDGLQKYADPKPQEENTVEEGAQKLGPLPSERKGIRRFSTFRHLGSHQHQHVCRNLQVATYPDSHQGDYEADQIT